VTILRPVPELPGNALVVFVSDSHIGGDPGCDGFESPAELAALFVELAALERPVELVLAGDFFDFLQIGEVPDGENRASLTMSRGEYLDLFAALKRFRSGEGKRVIYLPGNHDAEAWWNPEIGETLRGASVVDEFAYCYLASLEVGGGRRLIYCEHGNQLDAANTVEDYSDRLDTPLGHHVVTDFTRRVAPYGEVSPGLDLSEIKMVYPLVAIPGWVAGRYFYDFVGKAATYLLLPLLVAYALYRVAAYLVFSGGLPRVHELFLDIGIFGLFTVALFAVFFLVVRHAVRRTVNAMSPDGTRQKTPRPSPAEASRAKVREILAGEARPPMSPSLDPSTIDVFVSGHTHLPSLEEVQEPDGRRRVAVNSGCYLRQLHPVRPHLKGPPVFVSRFVLTHVRVHAEDAALRVELWERPKPARQRLGRIERLLSYGRRPPQPPKDAEARVRAASVL
jgi:UDP-2,3-diacylglucosamine pyrophosphatase LpxH